MSRCLIVIDDMWDEGNWNFVKGVIKDSAGTKIITTTRNLKIAEEVGGVYLIKPLSPDNSKKLLRTKAEAESHNTEFDEVSDKILRKCGGVPIAITMIGSFLANNKSKGWHGAYDSIGFDEHKKDGAFEHIRKVLSCSYYNLPYDIKKCLLYLSLFPEDHWIEKNMLIWRWVAEGLISDGLFETGEAHFSELVDRSIIQSAVSPRDVGQGGCRVHSLMLDLIRDLSSSKKENFATVLGMKQESTSETVHIHRLAIHKTSVAQNQNTSLEVGEVLSFYASTCPGSSFPPLSRFKRLRVIDLEDCDLSVEDCKLRHLEKLAGLGYIGLVGTHVTELPKKMGRLKFLQTLDVTATGLSELPSFIEDLKKLRCLRVGKGTRIMGRIGELTSLEELWLHSADKSPGFVIELRKLTELRVLVIHFDEIDDGMKEALVESLHQLEKLQVLQVWSDTEEKVPLGSWEASMPFPQLRQLLLFGVILPRPMSWIHRLFVPKLSKLLLQVVVLEKQHLEILGQMPSLHSLYLHSEDDKYRLSYTANKNEFKVLEYINTNIELICGDGGLPMIQELEVGGIRAGRDVGLRGNMPLLQRATYHLDCVARLPLRVRKAEEELRQAGKAHPNRPEITIRRWNNVVTEIWPKMEQIQGTSLRLVRPSSSEENIFLDNNPESLKQMSEDFARLELDNPIGAPPALRVDDATDATGSPSQGAALIEFYFKSMLKVHEDITDITRNEDADANASSEGNDGAGPIGELLPEPDATGTLLSAVLSWFNSQDGAAKMSKKADMHGMDLVAYKRIWKKCVLNPELIAIMDSVVHENEASEYVRLHEQLMGQEILDYMAGHDIDEPSSPPGYVGSSPEPLPPKVDADNMHSWLVGMYGAAHVSALMSKGAAKFGIDPTAFETMWMKYVLNPEQVADMDSAVQNHDGSEFKRLIAQVMEAENSRPPPKLDIYDTFILWRNTTDGAAAMSEGAAEFGMDPAAFERILKKCMLNPELIPAMDSALQDDDGSWMELMKQLVEPETMHYFTEQYMDGPSSTPGYADDGQADGSSSGQDGEKVSRMLRQVLPTVEQVLKAGASSRQPSAAQVIADNELNYGGPADASGMLSGLSSSPAHAAQSDMIDVVARSTATVAQIIQNGENSLTMFNWNERLAALEKASAAGENSSTVFNLNELKELNELIAALENGPSQRKQCQRRRRRRRASSLKNHPRAS